MIPRVGDIIEIRLGAHVVTAWIVAWSKGYPPALALQGAAGFGPARLVPIARAYAEGAVRVIGHHTGAPRPLFRVPILDRNGEEIYAWIWDGESIRLPTPGDNAVAGMPVRCITTVESLVHDAKHN